MHAELRDDPGHKVSWLLSLACGDQVVIVDRWRPPIEVKCPNHPYQDCCQ